MSSRKLLSCVLFILYYPDLKSTRCLIQLLTPSCWSWNSLLSDPSFPHLLLLCPVLHGVTSYRPCFPGIMRVGSWLSLVSGKQCQEVERRNKRGNRSVSLPLWLLHVLAKEMRLSSPCFSSWLLIISGFPFHLVWLLSASITWVTNILHWGPCF